MPDPVSVRASSPDRFGDVAAGRTAVARMASQDVGREAVRSFAIACRGARSGDAAGEGPYASRPVASSPGARRPEAVPLRRGAGS